MEREKMSKESRDELLERILEETARKPYKPSARPAQRKAIQPEKKSAATTEAVVQQQAVQPKAKPEETVKPVKMPEETFLKKEEPNIERTQVFEGPDMNSSQAADAHQTMTASEKIQKIKQEKAAAAKAAIMRKAEIDNSRIMQNNGNFEVQSAPAFADENEEKVNIVMPEEDYYEAFDEMSGNDDSTLAATKVLNAINIALYIVFVFVIIFSFIFNIAGVSGDSMSPTLKDGEKFLALNVGYTPERGDVVIIDNKTAALLDESGNITEKTALDCMITKRVIAVGGDNVEFDFENGTVTVNGQQLEEEYISEPTTRDEGAFEYPLTIPEGYVFVLGDNRNISKDSRHGDIGLVPADEVVGKALFKVYPFNVLGSIK